MSALIVCEGIQGYVQIGCAESGSLPWGTTSGLLKHALERSVAAARPIGARWLFTPWMWMLPTSGPAAVLSIEGRCFGAISIDVGHRRIHRQGSEVNLDVARQSTPCAGSNSCSRATVIEWYLHRLSCSAHAETFV